MSLTSIVVAIVNALDKLPVVRNLPVSVKKILGDVLTVAVSIVAILAVVSSVGVNLHVPTTDLTYVTTGASVLTALVAAIRRELAVKVAASRAARG